MTTLFCVLCGLGFLILVLILVVDQTDGDLSEGLSAIDARSLELEAGMEAFEKHVHPLERRPIEDTLETWFQVRTATVIGALTEEEGNGRITRAVAYDPFLTEGWELVLEKKASVQLFEWILWARFLAPPKQEGRVAVQGE